MRSDVRKLLCLLTKDNAEATQQLNDILIERVGEAVGGQRSNPAVVRNSLLISEFGCSKPHRPDPVTSQTLLVVEKGGLSRKPGSHV